MVVGEVDDGFHHSDGVGNSHPSFGMDLAVAADHPTVAPGLPVVMLMGGVWGYSGERLVVFVIGQT